MSQDELNEALERIWKNDARGWDSAEDEHFALIHAIDMLEHSGEVDSPGRIAMLREFNRRSDEGGEVIEPDEEACEETKKWVERLDVFVLAIPPNIVQLAAEWFNSPQGYRGVEAYCRHHYTNYEVLLQKMQFDPLCVCTTTAYGEISDRIHEALAQALEKAGFGEDSLFWWDREDENGGDT